MKLPLGILITGCCLLGACSDEFADGVRAYRDGRYREALAALSEAEREAGHGASAELLCDLALAALRAGELRVAEYTAEKAVVRGGAELAPWRDFLFGNTAFARSAFAEAETELLDPDPTAFTRAIRHAEAAREAWRGAAMSRTDWPAARRNVARAQRRLEQLRAKRDEAERQRRAQRERAPSELPEPETPDPRQPTEQIEQQPVPQQAPDATSDELAALLAVLEAKEREKRELRRARREMRTATVEKDW